MATEGGGGIDKTCNQTWKEGYLFLLVLAAPRVREMFILPKGRRVVWDRRASQTPKFSSSPLTPPPRFQHFTGRLAPAGDLIARLGFQRVSDGESLMFLHKYCDLTNSRQTKTKVCCCICPPNYGLTQTGNSHFKKRNATSKVHTMTKIFFFVCANYTYGCLHFVAGHQNRTTPKRSIYTETHFLSHA